MTLSNFIPTTSDLSNLIYRSDSLADHFFTTSAENCPFTGNIVLETSTGGVEDPYFFINDDGYIILRASDMKKNEDQHQVYMAKMIGTKKDGKKAEIVIKIDLS